MRRYMRRSMASRPSSGFTSNRAPIALELFDVVCRNVFGGAARSRDHGLDIGVLGERAQLAAGEVDGKMPGIVLALLSDRAADAGAGRNGLRQRRCERAKGMRVPQNSR